MRGSPTRTWSSTGAIALVAVLAGCSPEQKDYWADGGIDAGDTDVDTDADSDTDGDTDTDTDSDTDTDTDTEECEEDGSTECGDGGDTDTWTPDAAAFCESPEFLEFAAATGYPFDNSQAPYQGNIVDPQVVITGFSFFYCPHCGTAGEMVSDLLDDPAYGDYCAYYFRNYVYDLFPPSSGCTAHRAGWAAHQQGLFWGFHDGIFATEEVVLTEEELFDLAEDAGCEMTQFAADYDAPETLELLTSDKEQGQDAGVSGTPSIFVDGKKIGPFDALPFVLDCLLGYTD
jgi:hypothetical protein